MVSSMDIVDQDEQRTPGMMKGLERLTYRKRLRVLGLFSLEKGSLENLIRLGCAGGQEGAGGSVFHPVQRVQLGAVSRCCPASMHPCTAVSILLPGLAHWPRGTSSLRYPLVFHPLRAASVG